MMKRFRTRQAPFSDIFSLENEESKGRVIALTSSLLTTFYNVFITGIFYTGFLTMYGMSITDTGILTFIPFIANLLSIFSPKLLGRFKHRKRILITAKIIYYAIYIVVATIMPQFVTDPDARLACFIIILAVSTGFYALFGTGFTTWFYNFYPADTDKRTRYITLSHIFASIMSSVVLLFSSLLTDALSDSPYQDTLILFFRYFAFVLVLVDVFVQSRAKEYPYEETPDIKLTDVFILPFRHHKFLACMLLQFAWNFIANLNNGLWNFHLLNHMNFSYTLINTMSVMYTVLLIIFSPMWQRVLRRYSWVKTFGIAMLFVVPTEFVYFCMSPETAFLYVPNTLFQKVINVGLNISYGNILYMNLPSENSTTYLTFNTIGCNIFAFFGLMVGTWISSITGDDTMRFLGMDVYAVQFTTIARAALITPMAIFLCLKWKIFTHDNLIAELEHLKNVTKKHR